MWHGFEGRKFPRVKADCCIYIKQLDHGGQPITTTTENIGMGGICVILSESLEKFSTIKMDLDLGDGGQRISCDGRVAWIVPSRDFVSGKLTHDTGIEFLNLSQTAHERIEQMIRSRSHDFH